jgi:hypothetical protein
MLEGVLASGDSLRGADSVWNMAFKYDAHFLCFVGDGEIGFPGNSGLDLDEVGAAALKHIDSLPAVVRICDGNGCLVMGGRAIEHRAGDEHAGTEKSVCGDLVAGVENRIKCAAHVADTGDAVGKEEWEDEVVAVIGHAVEVDVGVHIPKAGDEVLALGVDDLPCFGSVPAGILHAQDSVSVDDDGGIGVHGSVGNIDDLRVRDGERLGSGTRGQGKSEKEALEGSHQIIVLAKAGFDHELDGRWKCIYLFAVSTGRHGGQAGQEEASIGPMRISPSRSTGALSEGIF